MTNAFLSSLTSGEYLSSLPLKLLLIVSLIALARRAQSASLRSPAILGLATLSLLTLLVSPTANGAMVWYHENIAIVADPRLWLQSIRLADGALLAATILLLAIRSIEKRNLTGFNS